MAMDFSGGAGAGTPYDLIPHGTIVFVHVSVRGVKASKTSDGRYIETELTVYDNQPYARRKVFQNIMDPMHGGNSEAARQMGMVAVTRILEAGRWGARPGFDVNQFKAGGGYTLEDYSQLSNLVAAAKIVIQKGEDGYDDKNQVGEWLTPNPASQSGFKLWERLMQGKFTASGSGNFTPPQPAQTSLGFGQPATASAAPSAGFGNPQNATQMPPAGGAQPGFQQPQGQPSAPAAPPAFGSGPMANGPAAGASAPPSPFSGGAQPNTTQPGGTPSWLQQAQGQQ